MGQAHSLATYFPSFGKRGVFLPEFERLLARKSACFFGPCPDQAGRPPNLSRKRRLSEPLTRLDASAWAITGSCGASTNGGASLPSCPRPNRNDSAAGAKFRRGPRLYHLPSLTEPAAPCCTQRAPCCVPCLQAAAQMRSDASLARSREYWPRIESRGLS